MRLFYLLPLAAAAVLAAEPAPNTLSPQEQSEGWKLLFDGRTMKGWDDPSLRTPPGTSWKVADGWLVSTAKPALREDLLTKESFTNFDLRFEWKIGPRGNTGIKYGVQELVFLDLAKMPPGSTEIQDHIAYELKNHPSHRNQLPANAKGKDYSIGFEFQLIDDAGHPDATDHLHSCGSLYGFFVPARQVCKPAGEINEGRLVVRGNHTEQWINGVKVVDGSLDDPAVRKGLADRWGTQHIVYKLLTERPKKATPIALQHHGDAVAFRSLRIRRLP